MDNQIKNTLRLSDKELPDIKDWEVGKEYEVVLTVKMIAKRQGSEWDTSSDNKEVNATFEITEAETEEEEEEEEGEDGTGSDLENYEDDYAKKMTKANKR
jgi:hypothetical protein